MRKLLIVSPHFPPVNAADMHRVRLSLPFFREFGWQPIVLAVDPAYVDGCHEPDLLETIPQETPVTRVPAIPVNWTRRLGVTAIGLRCLPWLHRQGLRLIRQEEPDLVYFSTTMFYVMSLARVWKQRFGLPVVLDIQDPWANQCYWQKPKSERGFKHDLVRHLHRFLQNRTIPSVDGIVAVSDAYHEELRNLYPSLPASNCLTIPFGASSSDFAAATRAGASPPFDSDPQQLHGVYVGRLGSDMRYACSVICRAFQLGLKVAPDLFGRMRLHFLGTNYATGRNPKQTIRPIAAEMGLDQYFEERPERIPYLSALRALDQADFLLVPGSDDARYTASKIYPYILAKKPLLALFHRASSVVDVLRKTHSGDVVTFQAGHSIDAKAQELMLAWRITASQVPSVPDTDWGAFKPYTAREMTRRQCELFDRIVSQPVDAPAHNAAEGSVLNSKKHKSRRSWPSCTRG